MVADAYSKTPPTASQINQVDDWLYAHFNTATPPYGNPAANNYLGYGTNTTELAALAAGQFGLTNSAVYSGWTMARLQQELANGYPVVVYVYQRMEIASHDAHYMVLLGMDSQNVYMDDPGLQFGGQRSATDTTPGRAYPIGLFAAAWAALNNSGVSIHPNQTTGSITVNATLDGSAWPGSGVAAVNFSIAGPGVAVTGTGSVPLVPIVSLQPAAYTLTYSSGGPANSTLSGIAPCGAVTTCSKPLAAGQTLTFVLQFKSNPPTAGFVMSSGTQSATESQTLSLSVASGSSANVTFDGTGRSSAVNGASITGWQWTLDGAAVASTGTFSQSLAVGTHTVSLVVMDSRGAQSPLAAGAVVVSLVLTKYSITDLGVLPGTSGCTAIAVNNAGQVAGNCGSNAFFWTGAAGMINLGTFPGGVGSVIQFAHALNDAGQVVGYVFDVSGNWVPFLSNSGGSLQALGIPSGATEGRARGINALGHIAMDAQKPVVGTESFLDENGAFTDLGVPNLGGSGVSGINDLDQVIGIMHAVISEHAFLWSGGTTTDLGILPSSNPYAQSLALSINNAGQVVGWSGSAGNERAFSWTSGSGMVDLGTLPGATDTMAKAINNGGDIVGQATDTSGNGRAVRWSHDGSIVDLNTLIPQGLGWTLTDAAAINNLGQIVGSGMHNGQARAYLLTPQ